MSDDKYVSDAQQRICDLIRTLAGNEITGLAPGEIAKLQVCSPSQVTRDLANLKHRGWAAQLPTGRWRLGPEIVQIALRHMVAIDRAQRQFDGVRQRFALGVDPADAAIAADQYVRTRQS